MNIFYILKKTKIIKKEMAERQKKDPQYWIISFYSKDISTFNELVIKNNLVKR